MEEKYQKKKGTDVKVQNRKQCYVLLSIKKMLTLCYDHALFLFVFSRNDECCSKSTKELSRLSSHSILVDVQLMDNNFFGEAAIALVIL